VLGTYFTKHYQLAGVM